MPVLTLEVIRENPWNVVSHALPTNPTELLLKIAHLAADYCRQSKSLLMEAAREGRYTSPGWQPTPDSSDVHEENEARAFQADRKLNEICDVCEAAFGQVN